MYQPDKLRAQFHLNQSVWVARLATGQMQPHVPHPRILQINDTLAILPGESGVIMLPMGGEPDAVMANHDETLTWLRQNHTRDVLTWSMKPSPAIDLKMLAQGYNVGFEPYWMTRDLTAPIPEPRHTFRMVTDNDIRELVEDNVPYLIREQIPDMQALIGSTGQTSIFWIAALHRSTPVGHAVVHVMNDHAGLFNVGVSGGHRHRGVGTSLTLAAMQIARDNGALTMNLNSTEEGRRLYDHTGFVHFGEGQTWTRAGAEVHRSLSPAEQALILAIGLGDIRAISGVEDLRHFSNNMSPQELSVRFGQREMLLHLIAIGAVPDIIALWDLGLRNEAIAATRDSRAREFVSRRPGARPVHHAIIRGAGTLVVELIAAGANLAARDNEYNATPLDWAHANNKPTIARIIRQAGGR